MDRRGFLRATGLGLIALPAARLLAACSLPPSAVTTTTGAAATTSAATSPTATATTAPPRSTATSPPTAAARLAVICRTSWGAVAPRSGLVAHTIERMTVHHTGVVLDDNRAAPSRLRGHQVFHLGKGWPDLAYHYAVDRNGNIYEGRSTDFKGDTATNYDPSGHFLVVAEGDFEHQTISDAQVGGVAGLLAWASNRFGVSSATIRGHRDWASTSCPGSGFYPMVADGTLAARVEALIAAGGVVLDAVCGTEGDALVTAIEAGQEPPAAAFYLRNSNTPGPADQVIELGKPGWIPVSGDFG